MTHSREIKSFDFELVNSVVKNIYFRARLREFAAESNRIEGITNPDENERMFNKLDEFLKIEKLTVEDVCSFNEWGELRDKEGMDVFVGRKRMPDGGEHIKGYIRALICSVKYSEPFKIHKDFEKTHPFTDGNGRTGRAIWLWQMVRQHDYDLSRGFLHEYYYQSLRG